jgi:hypothetical protein
MKTTFKPSLQLHADFVAKMSSLTVIFFALFVLAGAFIEFPNLYRPLNSGEATHPLTAILAITISFQLVSLTAERMSELSIINCLSFSFFTVCIVIIDKWLGIYFIDGLTSYIGAFAYEEKLGLNTQIGLNTCVMFLLLAVSHFFLFRQWHRLSSFFGLGALTVIGVSYIGYVYKENELYGSMSLTTMSLGLLLCSVTLLKTIIEWLPNERLQSLGGKQVFSLFSILILLPFFAILFLLIEFSNGNRLFNFLLVALPWVFAYFAVVGTVALDRVDRVIQK